MSRLILLMGESGAGKTTSLRTLNSDETYYIDCDRKGLNWRGWREQYNKKKKNYYSTRDIPSISNVLKGLNEQRPEIHAVVIDTLNTCMVDQEVKGMKETGFGKWVDLSQYVWNMLEEAAKLRDDLTIIAIMHSETIRDDLGYSFTRVKTNGRKLEKLVLESLFSTVLLAKRTEDGRYVFETQAKNSTAKTPFEAFSSFEIENDMAKVLEVLSEY